MTAARVCLYFGLACICIVLVAGGAYGLLYAPAPTVIIIVALGAGALAWALWGREK